METMIKIAKEMAKEIEMKEKANKKGFAESFDKSFEKALTIGFTLSMWALLIASVTVFGPWALLLVFVLPLGLV